MSNSILLVNPNMSLNSLKILVVAFLITINLLKHRNRYSVLLSSGIKLSCILSINCCCLMALILLIIRVLLPSSAFRIILKLCLINLLKNRMKKQSIKNGSLAKMKNFAPFGKALSLGLSLVIFLKNLKARVSLRSALSTSVRGMPFMNWVILNLRQKSTFAYILIVVLNSVASPPKKPLVTVNVMVRLRIRIAFVRIRVLLIMKVVSVLRRILVHCMLLLMVIRSTSAILWKYSLTFVQKSRQKRRQIKKLTKEEIINELD